MTIIRILIGFLLLAILSVIGYWFYLNPGFVLLNWLDVEIRIPIYLFALTFLVLFFIAFIIFKAVRWVLCLPFRLSKQWTEHRLVKGGKELLQLASAVAVENTADALKHIKRAKSISDKNPLYWWYAAHAYGMNEQHLEESKAYGRLTDSAPLLAYKGQVTAALRRDDRQSALEYLEKARDMDPKAAWILRNLLTLYRSFRRYQEAEDVINELEDLSFFSHNQAKKQLALLYEVMSDDTQLSDQSREEALRKAHFLDPSLGHVTKAYACMMMEQGHHTNAKNSLVATWNVSPSQSIGDLYVKLQNPENSLQAFDLVKNLVKDSESIPESQFILARYAIKAKLWGEARKILLQLEKQNPSPNVYGLLASLELQEHNDLKKAHHWAMRGYEGC